ncbi:carbohydrate sulfotransferase 11-like [Amphiura filiformis]|uniref:carbohydrate sulfotransferase 11-like n=1 Tax=Amphiura filiformis TaxID=82378 RepID=UPI003B222CCC
MEVPARWCRGRKIPVIVVAILILVLLFMFYNAPQNFVGGGGNEYDRKTRLKDSSSTSEKIDAPTDAEIFNKIRDSQQQQHQYDEDEVQFMTQQAEIQRQRQQTLRYACEKLNVKTRNSNNDSVPHPKRFIVDERAKLVYCSIAKIASTNWRLLFEQLAGLVDVNKDENQKTINRALRTQLTFIKDLSPDKAYTLMGDSLTFMFARHPFSRVLSSYRNKLDPNTTFERAYHWQNSLGEYIIDLYRHNMRPRPRRKMKPSKRKNKNPDYDLTFSEFVRFLGDRDNKEDRFFYNIHWCEMNEACSPCNVRYDVIGKLETIENDAKYILKLAHLDGIVALSGPEKTSSPTFSFKNDTLEQYLKEVPAEYIWKLYRRYRSDFEMFGYELPPIAVQKIKELK